VAVLQHVGPSSIVASVLLIISGAIGANLILVVAVVVALLSSMNKREIASIASSYDDCDGSAE
jgi:hypothetical protein